jgi:formylglycine-generating enzyme required for sulfatase activity
MVTRHRKIKAHVSKSILILVVLISAFSLSITGESAGSETSGTIRDPYSKALTDLEMVNPTTLRRAISDLIKTFDAEYSGGQDYLNALDACEKSLPEIKDALKQRDGKALRAAEEIMAFQRQALLSNPLLKFDRLLLIKRKPVGDPRRAEEPDKGIGKFVGMPQQDWENEICALSPVEPGGKLTTIYRPSNGRLVSEIDLDFDADKLMFSMPDKRKLWQVYEIGTNGRNLRQLSPGNHPDVHNYDSCYLPDGRVVFISTAPFQGVPCNASVNVGMSYVMDSDGGNIRQLCFEQDHNYCPSVMNDGRVLYLRWEYTDIPHVWARFLFTMNPDGTSQREFYGSGGYWPNAIFYTRSIPDHPTKIVGIVTGHHVGRVGEMVVFDPALGRKATDGVIQRIGSSDIKIRPLIQDKLAMECWPKFLHPWPLSEKYFLAACKPRPHDLWGIYLVDTFDNMVLLKEIEGYALLEPIPLRKTKRPPVIVDRVDLARDDALVFLEDIYKGQGLKNVPRGAVKKLRLFTYHFGYHKVAGINHRVGADGPWEPKRILGTVPVEADGSAVFRVPANTPISIQPLDAEGKAMQLMRSWMTAMPGEIVSCVGCHETQSTGPPNQRTIAAGKQPSEIEPWHGPARGFSFKREVQPVLDKYCISCHDGGKRNDSQEIPDLRADQGRFYAYKNGVPKANIISGVSRERLVKAYGGVFEPSYITLRSFVRVGGLESDLRILAPGEFSADTTELVQMLSKGHYGVELDPEAWHRIMTWIDLNAPCHGNWAEVVGQDKMRNNHKRRLELRRLYGGPLDDPEVYPAMESQTIAPVIPHQSPRRQIETPSLTDWPLGTIEAKRMQSHLGTTRKVFDLADNIKIDMVLVPAGRFIMGDADGCEDELPAASVRIDRPFWMSRFEVTNALFAKFDPSHDSKYEHKGSWMFNEWDLGWALNEPNQPVCRVSWDQAIAFCRWLSVRISQDVSLPTEAQWEWACRAGSDTPLSYGNMDTDFSQFGNMADVTIRELVYDVRDQYPPDLVPRDTRFNDGKLVTANVGSYHPNAWGLHDMHGNVWEWTRSKYLPYPYNTKDGRNSVKDISDRVVRGGSWYDRPKRCRSGFRLSYPVWRKVYNVGFRIVIESDIPTEQIAKSTR